VFLGVERRAKTCRIKPTCNEMLDKTSDLSGSCEHGNELSDSIKCGEGGGGTF
jgi:hypothetical protein